MGAWIYVLKLCRFMNSLDKLVCKLKQSYLKEHLLTAIYQWINMYPIYMFKHDKYI